MTRTGIDYAFSHPSPSSIRAAGYTFVCRYLSLNSSKNLTKNEAAALIAAGIDIVCNWEAATSAALNGFARGVTDAKEALSQALACGMPATRPIYFSVDFDATAAQQTAISAYFDGVISVIGLKRCGAYGGYYVIQRLFNAGKITWGWQSYAWSGGRWDARAQLRQVQNGITVGGAECDADLGMTVDFGQWGRPVPTKPPIRFGRWLARNASGSVQAYVRNTDNSVSSVAPSGPGWSVVGGDIGGIPAVVTDTAGHIQIYVRGNDHSLQHATPSGGWSSLGGVIGGDPCVLLDSAGHVQVFLRGGDNTLQHVDPSGGGWSSLGGVVAGDPAAILDGAGHIQIYVRGVDNTLQHVNPSSSGWSSIGGNVAGDPCVMLDAAGHVHVYVRGENNTLQHVDTAGAGWSSMGGVISGDPWALLDAKDHIQIYARAGNILWNVDPSGVGWTSIGGNIAGDPVAMLDSIGNIQVFARGADNTLQRALPEAGWSSLGGNIAN